MLRTHYNNEISKELVGKEVIICGWVAKVRNLGALVFFDVRDTSGFIQVRIEPKLFEQYALKNEYCLAVKGKVKIREAANEKIHNGDLEIFAEEIQIFSKSELTPFIIADETDALEDTRLKYRYLDLRRPTLQSNFRLRAKIVSSVHEYLDSNNFLEVETPMLIKTTPEGAREYLVPSRIRPGSFYALPQSPQMFKQLLMVAGFDRYYQIARCFRDEDLRADRQPEFTQIDIETSFLGQDEIFTIVEGMMENIFLKTKGIKIQKPFKKITYRDALDTYGSDKPDTRYGLHLSDLTSLLKDNSFEGFNEKFIKGFKVEGVGEITTRKAIDEINLLAKKMKIHGVTVLKFINGELSGSFTKFLSSDEQKSLISHFILHENDIIIFAADSIRDRLCFALGAIRTKYCKELKLTTPDNYDILWVVDWPLFDKNEDGTFTILHHPFTRPRDEDASLLYTKPEEVLSRSYDLVINGYELSSGSLRIFDQEMQRKVFEIIGFTPEEISSRFGFFVDALKYGTPPHGGLAIGLERLTMILAQTDNIKDVVAFPKNLSAICPMSDAPSLAPEESLNDLSIVFKKERNNE